VSWPTLDKLSVEDHLSRAPDVNVFGFLDRRDRIASIKPLDDLSPSLMPRICPEGDTKLASIREDHANWDWKKASRTLRTAVRADRRRWQHVGPRPGIAGQGGVATATTTVHRPGARAGSSGALPPWRPG